MEFFKRLAAACVITSACVLTAGRVDAQVPLPPNPPVPGALPTPVHGGKPGEQGPQPRVGSQTREYYRQVGVPFHASVRVLVPPNGRPHDVDNPGNGSAFACEAIVLNDPRTNVGGTCTFQSESIVISGLGGDQGNLVTIMAEGTVREVCTAVKAYRRLADLHIHNRKYARILMPRARALTHNERLGKGEKTPRLLSADNLHVYLEHEGIKAFCGRSGL